MISGEVMALMARRRLVAELRTETAVQALGTIEALVAGGIGVIEVSLATPGATEILTHFAARPDVLVGAGGVLDARQAAAAISSGARFVASPIGAAEIVPICREANVACLLGALTPTEILAAQRAGAEMVKLFPIESLGGPAYVRGLLRQLTHVSLQVSGGLTPQTMGEYLELPVRSLALGALLVPRGMVEHSNWQALTARARAFVEYAGNPHEYAARFLALMGVAAAPRPALPAPAAGSAASPPGFKPWDSRPVQGEGEEEWLR